MSNNLKTSPIIIDTFSDNVTISTTTIKVKTIVFWSTGADDTLVLEDNSGVPVVYLALAVAKDTKQINFGEGVVFNGLTLDVSDGTYTTASRLLIYM